MHGRSLSVTSQLTVDSGSCKDRSKGDDMLELSESLLRENKIFGSRERIGEDLGSDGAQAVSFIFLQRPGVGRKVLTRWVDNLICGLHQCSQELRHRNS